MKYDIIYIMHNLYYKNTVITTFAFFIMFINEREMLEVFS